MACGGCNDLSRSEMAGAVNRKTGCAYRRADVFAGQVRTYFAASGMLVWIGSAGSITFARGEKEAGVKGAFWGERLGTAHNAAK
jgi:hypothetical protein